MEYQVTQKPIKKYFCVHCRDMRQFLNYVYSFDSIETVHGHWLSNHTDVPHALPFQFYAIDFVACLYCSHSGLIGKVKAHHAEKHTSVPFVVVRASNRNQCAFCLYDGPNLAEHTLNQHNFLLECDLFNPVCFTPERLTDLLANNFHQKRQCGQCQMVFETDHEVEIHHFKQHPNVDLLRLPWNGAGPCDVAHLICHFCYSHVEPHNFYAHIAQDLNTFNVFATDTSSDDTKHKRYGTSTAERFLHKLMEAFLKTKVVFHNGLVAFKQNLLLSQFDDSQQFMAAAALITQAKFHANEA